MKLILYLAEIRRDLGIVCTCATESALQKQFATLVFQCYSSCIVISLLMLQVFVVLSTSVHVVHSDSEWIEPFCF